MKRMIWSVVAVSMVVSVSAHAGESREVPVEQARALLRKIDRHLKRGEVKRGAALAEKELGPQWCDFYLDGEGDWRVESRLLGSLTVTARRAKKPTTAAFCAQRSIEEARSVVGVGGVLFELSLAVDAMSLEQWEGFIEEHGDFWRGSKPREDFIAPALEPWDDLDRGASSKQKARAKQQSVAKLMRASFAVNPRPAITKRLLREGKLSKKEIRAHLQSYLPRVVAPVGPLPSLGALKEKIGAKKKAKVLTSAPAPAEVTEPVVEIARVIEECELDVFVVMVTPRGYFAVPLLGNLYTTTGECGGYGSESNVKKLARVKRSSEDAPPTWRARAKTSEYINTGNGPDGRDVWYDLHCEVRDGAPRCVDLRRTLSWGGLSEEGAFDVNTGVRASFGPDGKLRVKKLYVPAALRESIRAGLEGASLKEIIEGREKLLDRLVEELSS